MSSIPPPIGPGVGYHSQPIAMPSPRPTVVTVLSIIGIIWSSLTLLVGIFAAAMVPLMLAGKPPYQGLKPLSGGWLIFTILSPVLSLVLATLLISSSICCLRLRPWARKGMLVWAAATIVFMIINVVIQTADLNPQLVEMRQHRLQQYSQVNGSGISANNMQAIQKAGTTAGIIVGVGLMIYPIWILATFNSPRVKSAFGEPPVAPV